MTLLDNVGTTVNTDLSIQILRLFRAVRLWLYMKFIQKFIQVIKSQDRLFLSLKSTFEH